MKVKKSKVIVKTTRNKVKKDLSHFLIVSRGNKQIDKMFHVRNEDQEMFSRKVESQQYCFELV